MNNSHRGEVVAFDREKRVYKDAYVDSFCRVRHFPALATIGTGRSDGASIILVQETPTEAEDSPTPVANPKSRRARLADTPSRVIPADPLEEFFESTPPLSNFRSAVMCKHTKARAESGAASTASRADEKKPLDSAFNPRYGAVTTKETFKLTNCVDAKTAIERKVVYDAGHYCDKSAAGRSLVLPSGQPQWSYTSAVTAKNDVRNRTFFHLPPEGAIRADRKYTQEFIRRNIEAYELSRQQPKTQT